MALSPLQNKLRTSSGQLADVSSEELAAQTGRAAPTSPMENKVIGGTSQQAAMAGTPNQKTSALRQAIQGSASLQTRQRLQQPTTEISAAQQAQKDKLSELQALSGMEGRVGELIDTKFSGAESLKGLQFNLDKAPEEDRALLQRIQEGDTKAIAEYANSKGISAQEAADQIKANYAIDSGISEQVSATTADLINNTEVDFTELGYTGTPEDPTGAQAVADLLGIPKEEFMNMNLGDTIDFINKRIEEEYNTSDSLRAILDDPSVGPAEKADARQQLRDMGAVGIKAAESDAEQLADDVAQSKTIEFNGEETTIDKILEDEYLEGVIANALENEEFMDELKENEPGLAEFIEKNKDVLTGISEQIDADTQMVIETTEANKALSGGLDESIMKSIYGDTWGKVSDTKLEIGGSGLLSYVNDPSISKETKETTVRNINELASSFPGLVPQFKQLSAADMSTLGLDGSNPDKLEEVKNYYKSQEKLNNLISKYGVGKVPATEVYATMFEGSGKSPEEIQSLMDNAMAASNSGLFDETVPENPANILLSHVQSQGTLGIFNLVDGVPESLSGLKGKYESLNKKAGESVLFKAAKDVIADGEVTPEDLTSIMNRAPNLTIDDLQKLSKSSATPGYKTDSAIHKVQKQKLDQLINTELSLTSGLDIQYIDRAMKDIANSRVSNNEFPEVLNNFDTIIAAIEKAMFETSDKNSQQYYMLKSKLDKTRRDKTYVEKKSKVPIVTNNTQQDNTLITR